MSLYVVDASIAAKWFAEEEEHSKAAFTLTAGRDELHAPDFFFLEMDNVICTWIMRGRIASADGNGLRQDLRRYPIQTHVFWPLLDSAYAIATQTGRSVYDSLYVALAAVLGGPLVTADRRLYDALAGGSLAEHVVWVEEMV